MTFDLWSLDVLWLPVYFFGVTVTIDLKFDNQDRMINFMMNQIANVEKSMQQSTNIVRNNVDIDRDNLIKLKAEVRVASEQS